MRIDKNKHEHLIQCMEELRLLTTDIETAKRIEAELAILSEIYNRYNSFQQEIHIQVENYNSLYKGLQLDTYKELRKVRRALTK